MSTIWKFTNLMCWRRTCNPNCMTRRRYSRQNALQSSRRELAIRRVGKRPSLSPNENATEHNTHRAAVKPNMPFGISAVNSIDALRVGKLFDTNDATLNAYANPNTSG